MNDASPSPIPFLDIRHYPFHLLSGSRCLHPSPRTNGSHPPPVSVSQDQIERAGQPFDAIIVETTGVAKPAPIIQSFFADEKMRDLARLDSVLTLVDAVNIWTHLSIEPKKGQKPETGTETEEKANKATTASGGESEAKAEEVFEVQKGEAVDISQKSAGAFGGSLLSKLNAEDDDDDDDAARAKPRQERPEARGKKIEIEEDPEDDEDPVFQPGDRVTIQGLRIKPEYNGKQGEVRQTLQENGASVCLSLVPWNFPPLFPSIYPSILPSFLPSFLPSMKSITLCLPRPHGCRATRRLRRRLQEID